ncbi:hypothetical protein BV898_10398 [Hypsibius exemplaris]|uniref:Uncharacterized protein n=1 Tax=Hypsibius exemplaris TaxID=2072580 RepID=A0A1W0WJI7_HYPEX|nr:hypothetical protein BV898_10398 [Hypsibius exemplaris]
MNFLKQALAFFFPPNPSPMRQSYSVPQASSSSSHRRPSSRARGGPSASRQNPTSLPSAAERQTQSQLECELADNLRRAREYELENPNAFRQDIQRKVEHVLVKRPGRPHKRQDEPQAVATDSCKCEVHPAAEVERAVTQNRIKAVYVPSSCHAVSRNNRPRGARSPADRAVADSQSDTCCSCSASDCSIRSPRGQQQRCRSPSSASCCSSCSSSDNDASEHVASMGSSAMNVGSPPPPFQWQPSRTSLNVGGKPVCGQNRGCGGICLAAPVTVRTRSPVRRKEHLRNSSSSGSFGGRFRQRSNRPSRKRKSKTVNGRAAGRKRAKSR